MKCKCGLFPEMPDVLMCRVGDTRHGKSILQMSGEDTRQVRVLLHLPSLAKATARVFISFQLKA
jgi:hypothetical protein